MHALGFGLIVFRTGFTLPEHALTFREIGWREPGFEERQDPRVYVVTVACSTSAEGCVASENAGHVEFLRLSLW
jgi:hypothetical protein